jgi:ATP-dependent exoDNAse (exonuclease V), alpha subunit - helicase superfamily I member
MSFHTRSLTLRVTQGARYDKGGALFHGVEVDHETLRKINIHQIFLIHIGDPDQDAIVKVIHRGMYINLTPQTWLRLKKNPEHGQERFVLTTDQIEILRPTAEQIIGFLGEGSRFKGIGPVKAQKLWTFFGNTLYELLNAGDVKALTQILSQETALRVVHAWRIYADIDALHYCNIFLGLSISTSLRVSEFYRSETKSKLREDPYRLLAFGVTLKECDRIVKRQGLNIDSNLRLSASVEAALYEILAKGSTAASCEDLKGPLRNILYPNISAEDSSDSADSAIDTEIAEALNDDYTGNNYVLLEKGLYQSNGAFLMESFVAEYLIENICNSVPGSKTDHNMKMIIREYEQRTGFSLTKGQNHAVAQAFQHQFLIINGGAGVGKTTMLGALYEVFKSTHTIPIQLALTGKAAKRMTEATGHKSYTIEKFIHVFDFKDYERPDLVIVIDESSMVDLPSIYRLLTFIPRSTRIIMLGDTGQLPPINFGLIFHELVKLDFVPKVTLTEICRQYENSNIPLVSNRIRDGYMPELEHHDVSHIRANGFVPIKKLVAEIYQQSPDTTQIICPTNKMADAINDLCASTNRKARMRIFVDEFDIYMDTDFRVGDKVMCNKNIYKINLMNGSIGVVIKVYKDMKLITLDDNNSSNEYSSFGKILWDDGIEREVSMEVIEALQLAYAITIHKSQGSEFEKVIISLEHSPNLDRTMLYTAITRAQKEVVIIGDIKVLDKAINNKFPTTRTVDFGKKMQLGYNSRFQLHSI